VQSIGGDWGDRDALSIWLWISCFIDSLKHCRGQASFTVHLSRDPSGGLSRPSRFLSPASLLPISTLLSITLILLSSTAIFNFPRSSIPTYTALITLSSIRQLTSSTPQSLQHVRSRTPPREARLRGHPAELAGCVPARRPTR